jgi:hypothetical protein
MTPNKKASSLHIHPHGLSSNIRHHHFPRSCCGSVVMYADYGSSDPGSIPGRDRFFLSCTIGLHRNSTNGMHIIYDFLPHLLVQFTYIYREQPLVHLHPLHQRTGSLPPLTPANWFTPVPLTPANHCRSSIFRQSSEACTVRNTFVLHYISISI